MGMGLIYPCIYIAYACLLPFMSNHQYSVYGAFTNLDPKLEINGVAGNASALIYIFGALAGYPCPAEHFADHRIDPFGAALQRLHHLLDRFYDISQNDTDRRGNQDQICHDRYPCNDN